MPGARSTARLGAVLALVAGLVAACGGSTGSSQATIAASPAASAGTAATPAATPSSAPSVATEGPPGSGSPTASNPVASTVPIDPTLLDLLPSAVAGLPVVAVPDPTGTDDPGLVESVERMAQAMVIDPATDEFAYASVIVTRPGLLDDAYFRSWRDSFDEGACSQAGGVAGHAQATIGGRTAYVGTCTGGVLTYHVRLDDLDAIVSVSSLGDSRLGEQLVAGLRP